MTDSLETLRVDIEAGVAVITLDQPDRRNAFDLAMTREMVATVRSLEDDPAVGAMVVTGAPPAFCAGADLSHLEASAREGLKLIYEGFLCVSRSSLPSVAAVNGPAVGAGLNLALACDVRIAARSARFDCRFLDLGLHPGGGHTHMLQKVGGSQLAAAMVLFGERLDGEQAARCGLAWSAVADDELVASARALAARVASAPKPLVREVKATLRDTASLPGGHDLAVERELGPQAWSLGQPFFAERLAALKAKIRKTPR
ncbi:MAG: enoyl-CoA hydratase [Acidobacteriota bacterium]